MSKTIIQHPRTGPYTDLRDWLRAVEQMGELRRVDGASWQEDIGRVAEMLHHTEESPAVLFDAVPGYPKGNRVLINPLGARRRLAFTLGMDPGIGALEMIDAWEERLNKIEPVPVREVRTGPILENVLEGDAIDLYKFPTPKWHAEDGGRYIGTAVADVTRDPDSDWINFGTYRVMIHDRNHAGLYISPGKHGRLHRDKYFSRGQAMPVLAIVGMDPILFLASCLEIPLGVSEYEWAGAVKGEPVEIIRGRHTGLPLPAHAEIVIEGFVHPNARLMEGPFGEWTGYYASGSREEPVIDVKAIYHRNDPILMGCPPEKPPYEAHHFRKYLRSGLLRKALKDAGVPGITGVYCHPVGGCRLLYIVAIKQMYPGHARQAGLLSSQVRAGAYLNRMVVVVDEDIDITDLDDVMWAVLTRADPEQDYEIVRRCWSGPLDPAIHPDRKGFNSRVIIDATRPWEWRDRFPIPIGPDPAYKRETRERWGWLLRGDGAKPQ
jgi:UbiD family decarboxylase